MPMPMSMTVRRPAAPVLNRLLSAPADPLGQLVENGGACGVEPTIDAIAEGLRKMARLKASELAAMGARARRIVQEFGWDRPAQILSQAYRDSVGSEP